MKREILFKAKSFDNNQWIESMTIAKGTIKRKSNYLFMEINENEWVQVQPESLIQFINKTDKKQKYIFEGDYDADGNCIAWCNECNGFELAGIDIETKEQYLPCHRCDGNFFFQDIADDFEIIGNIYD